MKKIKKISALLLALITLFSISPKSINAYDYEPDFTSTDALNILKNVVGIHKFYDFEKNYYDLNNDGVINTSDALAILRIVAGNNAPPEFIIIKGERYSTDLTRLSLDSSELTNADIEPLRYMTNLEELYLRYNQISDISPLAGLGCLKFLVLGNNQISDISPLAGLVSLEFLILGNNQISDISPLADLKSLTSLFLNYNQISDISPLAGLTNLYHTNLENNRISDVSPLAGLNSLEILYLRNNQISDISPLAGLPRLANVSFSGNPISEADIAAFRKARPEVHIFD